MRFSPHFLDEIRDRVPISEIVGTRVTFDRRKSNVSKGDHWACCPFHGEKTPSFHCEDRKGRYHCFGCGASGDHFRFLTELGGLSFPEAVEQVAGLAGIAMPARDPEAEKRAEERASLADVMEIAARFFEDALQRPEGAAARAYLRERALTPATLKRFRIGFAPPSRNALKEHLAAKGIERARMEATGLLVCGPDIAVSYDRFRDRIIFPILDPKGRVISFGGRAMSPDNPAKYLNGPETELFSKSRVLYNLGPAREAARSGGALVAVEGYMDVIALAQAGIGQAVAPLGTALTGDQLGLMWRVSDEPILCFDGDGAGRRAAHRAIETALPGLGAGRSVRIATLPEGRDPDDLVREGGREAFDAVVAASRPLADALWARHVEGGIFDTPERRAALERDFREALRQIGDEDVRRHYEQEMRERLVSAFGTARGAGRGQGERGRGERGRKGSDRSGHGRGGRGRWDERPSVRTGRVVASEGLVRAMGGPGRITPREAVLMSVLVSQPSLVASEFDTVESIEFEAPALRALHSALLDLASDGGPDTHAEAAEHLEGRGHGETLRALEALVRRTRDWSALPGAALEDAHDCFAQAMHMHQRHSVLTREVRLLRDAAEADLSEDSFRRMVELQAEIRAVENLDAILEGYGAASGRPSATK